MRANIHPEYSEINVTCSCGHKFTTGSSLGKDLHIEVCNECHPFYTGKQKIVDTAGRVERFKGKFGSLSLNKNATADNASAPSEEASKATAPKAHAASKEKSAAAKPSAAPKAAKGKTSGASSKTAGEKKAK